MNFPFKNNLSFLESLKVQVFKVDHDHFTAATTESLTIYFFFTVTFKCESNKTVLHILESIKNRPIYALQKYAIFCYRSLILVHIMRYHCDIYKCSVFNICI